MIDKPIIKKYLQGKLTKQELDQLIKDLQLNNLSELKSYMQEHWTNMSGQQQELPASLSRSMLENIRKQSLGKRKIHILKLQTVWPVAAAIALLILAVFVLRSQLPLSYTGGMTVVHNPHNKVKEVHLHDGSVIWLNKNGKISYDNSLFNDQLRAVTLVGEAYFDIATDSTKPFIVTSGALRTRVLGTSFNIQAFPGSQQIKVALKEGKVSLAVQSDSLNFEEKAILSPGEEFTFDLPNKIFTTRKYLKNAPYAWRDGVIYFDNADIEEVKDVLENWYHIKLSIESKTATPLELIHRIDLSRMSLQQVLEGIDRVSEYHFEHRNNNEYVAIPD